MHTGPEGDKGLLVGDEVPGAGAVRGGPRIPAWCSHLPHPPEGQGICGPGLWPGAAPALPLTKWLLVQFRGLAQPLPSMGPRVGSRSGPSALCGAGITLGADSGEVLLSPHSPVGYR